MFVTFHLQIQVAHNSQAGYLSTPPLSPTSAPLRHSLPSSQKTTGFTINVPVDSSQPFTFTENNFTDEFPALSDLLYPSQPRPAAPLPAYRTASLMPPSAPYITSVNNGAPSYAPPIPGQSFQNVDSGVHNPAANNGGYGYQQSMAPPMAAPNVRSHYPGPYVVAHHPIPYGDGFIRSTAPSPSPTPFATSPPFRTVVLADVGVASLAGAM